jgi:hypothetical protein
MAAQGEAQGVQSETGVARKAEGIIVVIVVVVAVK